MRVCVLLLVAAATPDTQVRSNERVRRRLTSHVVRDDGVDVADVADVACACACARAHSQTRGVVSACGAGARGCADTTHVLAPYCGYGFLEYWYRYEKEERWKRTRARGRRRAYECVVDVQAYTVLSRAHG